MIAGLLSSYSRNFITLIGNSRNWSPILCINSDDVCRVASLPFARRAQLGRPYLTGVMLEVEDDAAEATIVE